MLDIINDRGPLGKDEDQGVKEAACLALGDLHDSALIPELGELLSKGGLFRKGRPDEIRAAACIALGNIGDPGAIPLLEKARDESSMMVSSSADKSLRKLKGEITSPEPVGETEEPVVSEETVTEQEAVEPFAPMFDAPEGLPAETVVPTEPETREGTTAPEGETPLPGPEIESKPPQPPIAPPPPEPPGPAVSEVQTPPEAEPLPSEPPVAPPPAEPPPSPGWK